MRWSRTLPDSEKGFTLIEVLVGVGLLSVIMMLIYATSSQTIQAKARVDRRREVTHGVRVALNKMSQDVSMAFLLSGPAQLGSRSGSALLKTVFKGSDSGEQDSFYFASLGHLRLFRNSKESESCEIGYKLERDPDNTENYRLMRRESKEIDHTPEEGGGWYPLIDKVKELDVEYYDARKKEWTHEWDSDGDMQRGRLPRAVRLKLGVENPNPKGESLEFETVTLIGMYANAIDF